MTTRLDAAPHATLPPPAVGRPIHIPAQGVPGRTDSAATLYAARRPLDYDLILTSGTALPSGYPWLNKSSAGYILTVLAGVIVDVSDPKTALDPEPQYELPPEFSALYALRAPKPLQDDAKALISSAKCSGLMLPQPRLTEDGEIMFYARKGQVYLDLGVHGDGTYSFFCRDAEGREFVSDDDVDVASGLDENVRQVLSRLA